MLDLGRRRAQVGGRLSLAKGRKLLATPRCTVTLYRFELEVWKDEGGGRRRNEDKGMGLEAEGRGVGLLAVLMP